MSPDGLLFLIFIATLLAGVWLLAITQDEGGGMPLSRRTLRERPADRYGHCDGCHDEHCQVWENYSQPGEWQYCAMCIRNMEDRRRKGLREKEKSDHDEGIGWSW